MCFKKVETSNYDVGFEQQYFELHPLKSHNDGPNSNLVGFVSLVELSNPISFEIRNSNCHK